MIDREPLKIASDLRVPVFPPGTDLKIKAEQMEDFMLLSAFWAGQCHSARLEALGELWPLEDRWEEVEGWEYHREGRTQKSIDEAKRVIEPDLYERIRDLRRWVKLLTDEIERLEKDAVKNVSRAYTILSGT